MCLRGHGEGTGAYLHLGEAGYTTLGPVPSLLQGPIWMFWGFAALPKGTSTLKRVLAPLLLPAHLKILSATEAPSYPPGCATAIIIGAFISSVKAHNWKLPPNSWNIIIPTVKYVFLDLKLIDIYALQKQCCNIKGLPMRNQTSSTCSSVSGEATPSGT